MMSARRSTPIVTARVKAVVHRAEEGGYWAEVPGLPGCFTQAETLAELRRNIQAAVDLYLSGADEGPPVARRVRGVSP